MDIDCVVGLLLNNEQTLKEAQGKVKKIESKILWVGLISLAIAYIAPRWVVVPLPILMLTCGLFVICAFSANGVARMITPQGRHLVSLEKRRKELKAKFARLLPEHLNGKVSKHTLQIIQQEFLRV